MPFKGAVDKWLADGSSPQLCLLGDFGTGKTTFLEYLHWSLAKNYLNKSTGRIPLLLSLRRYYEVSDHEELIRQFFALECSTNLQYSLFDEFVAQGRILLLLDGFDEMGAKSNQIIRKANYLKLAGLIKGNSKVIISCRPAYFLSLAETHAVFSFMSRQVGFAPPIRPDPISEKLFRVVQDEDLNKTFSHARSTLSKTTFAHLSLFDHRQVKAYLKFHEAKIIEASGGQINAAGLFTKMNEIYDLEDLGKRPILLKLIVSTLPLFKRTDRGTFTVAVGGEEIEAPSLTPSVLYSVYTEKEMEREYTKGRTRWLIERDEKTNIISAIAMEMFWHDTLSIDSKTLAEVIERFLPGNEADQAYYFTHIVSCSFMTRDNQEEIRFTHKSFMEYYASIAMRIQFASEEKTQSILSSRAIADEILFFVGDGIAASARPQPTLDTLLSIYRRLSEVQSPSSVCLQNILNILNYARVPKTLIRDVDIELLTFRKLELDKAEWNRLSVAKFQTYKTHFKEIRAEGLSVKEWNTDDLQVDKLVLQQSELKALRFWHSNVKQLLVTSSTIGFETWRESSITDGIFKDSILSAAGESVGSNWLPHNSRFTGCILLGLDLSDTNARNVRYEDCVFLMCRSIRASDLVVKGCQGVLLEKDKAGLRRLSNGLGVYGVQPQNRPTGSSGDTQLTWEMAILALFKADIQKLPKAENEIRSRLSQASVAAQMSRFIGKSVMVSGPFNTEEKCKLIKAGPQFAQFLRLRTQEAFQAPLRRSILKLGDLPHIVLEK